MSATFDRNLAALALTARAKWAFTTRRVCQSDAAGLLADFDQARPGDLLLGRVVRIGFQKRLQLASGRPAPAAGLPCGHASGPGSGRPAPARAPAAVHPGATRPARRAGSQ